MALPLALQSPIDVLMIDNFDSFTYNLYQSLCLLGANVTVIRNDAIRPDALPKLNIKHLIVSPGPGHPKTDSGISRDAIKYFTGKVPVLGVCMGLECLVDVFGGQIAYAGEIMHGKVSRIRHDGRGIFKSLPQSFKSTRYHSLSASISTLPSTLQISAVSLESGIIMGVRHRTYALEAVQYHPESCLSEQGDPLLRNFLALKGGTWVGNPHSGVLNSNLPPFEIEKGADGLPTSINAAKVPTILEKIYTQRSKDVDQAKRTPGTTPEDLETLLAMHVAPPVAPLLARLNSGSRPALMAEIKRSSPSKGPIAPSTNAASQALAYALAGASVISVLTEPTWFLGSLTDLLLARQAVSSLPNRPAILRKDFILDEYQIAESRVWGADAVLLIVAMLPEARLRTLYAYAKALGMEPLVEVNNEREMQVAVDLGAKVVGVNNRNLHDFKVDGKTTERLAGMVKGEMVLCALSGIQGPEEVRRYKELGVGAVLVGESLMRAADPGAFIKELLDLPAEDEARESFGSPVVKICGIRTAQEALGAAEAGADMLGLMFVPSSKRSITLDAAREISAAVRATRFRASASGDVGEGDGRQLPWFTTHATQFSYSSSSSRPLLVGVFQNQPLEYVLHIVSAAQLDAVQLHGEEPLEYANFIPVPVVRVFHVGDSDSSSSNGAEGLVDVRRPGLHQFVLLDSMRSDGKLSGGSGKVVDWDLARRIVDAGEAHYASGPISSPSPSPESLPQQNGVGKENGADATTTNGTTLRKEGGPKFPMPIILAGGLSPSNVREAIEKVRPWGVDVSGGVELDSGEGKDMDKVRAFVRAAKEQHVGEDTGRDDATVKKESTQQQKADVEKESVPDVEDGLQQGRAGVTRESNQHGTIAPVRKDSAQQARANSNVGKESMQQRKADVNE